MKTIVVRLKLKSIEGENVFERVKDIFIQDGYLFIVKSLDQEVTKLEPINLSVIDYWIEEGNLEIKKG